MIPYYQMLLAFCLFFAATTSNAQDFLTPLNGPRGVGNVSMLEADSSGAVYLRRMRQIYRSTDGGDIWTDVSTGWTDPEDIAHIRNFWSLPSGKVFAKTHFKLMQFDPSSNTWVYPDFSFGNLGIDNQGRLWASNSYKMYISTDDANTFQPVFNYYTVANGVVSQLAPYSDDHGLFVTSYGTGSTKYNLYHFNAAGETVLLQDSLNSVSFIGYSPYSGTAFYSRFDTLLRSIDGGLTWSPVTSDDADGNPLIFGKLKFEKSGSIRNGLYKSEDDGLTWAKTNIGETTFEKFLIAPDGRYYMSQHDCGREKLLRSSDNGATWLDISVSLKHPTVYDIQKDADANLYAYTCRNSAWEKSPDDGETWEDMVLPDVLPSSLAKQLVFIENSPVGMAISEMGNVFYTDNNGTNWTNASAPPGMTSQSRLLASPSEIFYMLNPDATSFKSTDKGQSWQQVNLKFSYIGSKAEFLSNDDIYLGNYDLFRYRADIDSTVQINFNGFGLIADFHYHQPSGLLFMWAKGPAYQDPMSMVRWNENTNVLDTVGFFNNKSVRYITSNSLGEIFVLSNTYPNTTLYVSKDNGVTWQEKAVLNKFSTQVYDLYIAPDDYLYFSIFGDVIHRSTDPTTNVSLPQPHVSSSSVHAYPNPFEQYITFEVNGFVTLGQIFSLRLFDALGREVRRAEFAGEQFVIQRQALLPGLYYFLIESAGKRIGAGKLEAK